MISVIISVYNAAPYIRQCIDSIRNQSYPDLEIIAVDDGSTDESGAICEDLARQDERIVVIHKENGGNASARNAGIDAARGDFLAFVDADDYIEGDMYETMLAEMRDPSVTIVCCGIIVTSVEGTDTVQVSKGKINFSKEEALFDFFAREGNVNPTACNKLYRSKIFKNGLRYNNDVIHEDTEVMPRFLNVAERVMVIDKAFYHYIKHPNSASTSKKFSLRGYHILDSMKEYERMCKNEYPRILPCFHYYELITTYEMLLNLWGCIDHKEYIFQQLSLRYRTVKAIFKCLRWKSVMEENGDQIKVVFVKSVLGMNLSRAIFHLN